MTWRMHKYVWDFKLCKTIPLNLSILLSGEEETNQDIPSKGDWRGKSSSCESMHVWIWMHWIVVWRCIVDYTLLSKSLGKGQWGGWHSCSWLGVFVMIHAYHESICLGLQFKVGGKFHLRLNIGASTIVHKYREGKMQRTLKRELKSAWNCWKGSETSQCFARYIVIGCLRFWLCDLARDSICSFLWLWLKRQ